jgi:hypothetical protein
MFARGGWKMERPPYLVKHGGHSETIDPETAG